MFTWSYLKVGGGRRFIDLADSIDDHDWTWVRQGCRSHHLVTWLTSSISPNHHPHPRIHLQQPTYHIIRPIPLITCTTQRVLTHPSSHPSPMPSVMLCTQSPRINNPLPPLWVQTPRRQWVGRSRGQRRARRYWRWSDQCPEWTVVPDGAGFARSTSRIGRIIVVIAVLASCSLTVSSSISTTLKLMFQIIVYGSDSVWDGQIIK